MHFNVTLRLIFQNRVTYVWVCDTTLPLFGWKYLLLFIVCVTLFILLLTLNVVLLFTKSLMRFHTIARFKPLIDAFQGSLKSQYSYWIGVQLLIRSIMIVLLITGKTLCITLSCLLILTLGLIQSYIQPYTNKQNSLQELLLLYNYAVMCVLLILNESETMNVITVNVLISFSFIHFVVIIIYHTVKFVTPFSQLKNKTLNACCNIIKNHCLKQKVYHTDVTTVEIPDLSGPEADLAYAEFREPLIGED